MGFQQGAAVPVPILVGPRRPEPFRIALRGAFGAGVRELGCRDAAQRCVRLLPAAKHGTGQSAVAIDNRIEHGGRELRGGRPAGIAKAWHLQSP